MVCGRLSGDRFSDGPPSVKRNGTIGIIPYQILHVLNIEYYSDTCLIQEQKGHTFLSSISILL